MKTKRWIRVVIGVGALSLALAACGSDSKSATTTSSSTSNLPTKIGKGEGALNLIIWAGYAESGKNDPKVNWVTPFEKQTGCQVTTKEATDSDEMVSLMRQGNTYDGVSASGDATLRLIAGKNVAPINVKLIKDFSEISPKLQSPPHNTVDGVHYGVSYMWGANVLMYNTKAVTPAPTSWASVFTDPGAQKGKVTAYNSPIYIADAALYLKSAEPSLGITDPYELTTKQFDAAVKLLKQQKASIKAYWGTYTDEIDAFKTGDVTIGQAWPYQVNTLVADKQPVAGIIPKEGATGWADTWMLNSKAQHPNCMYLWMNYTAQPDVQAQVAQWFGAAPANAATCTQLGKAFCDSYHVTDASYFNQISFWKTPLAACGNGKNDCVDYSKWATAWTDLQS
jgi:putative spermidine/putrescine transport system substrate-binding protein